MWAREWARLEGRRPVRRAPQSSREVSSLAQGSNGGDGKSGSDSGCVLKVKLIGFALGCGVGEKERSQG